MRVATSVSATQLTREGGRASESSRTLNILTEQNNKIKKKRWEEKKVSVVCFHFNRNKDKVLCKLFAMSSNDCGTSERNILSSLRLSTRHRLRTPTSMTNFVFFTEKLID